MKEINYEFIRKTIIDTWEECGIFIDESEWDFDINSYGIDSFIYISFIVALEEKLDMSIPDDFLTYEKFASINGFAYLLETLLANK